MRDNKRAAHSLVEQLAVAGVTAHASGAGVNWQVDAAGSDGRRLRVHCFWYDRAISGLMLGMNPANARRCAGEPARAPYEGPEYFVQLTGPDAMHVADGRTRLASAVVACARPWIGCGTIDEVVRDAGFIDEKRRKMSALAARVDASLRREVGGDPSYPLWIYGDGRSCELKPIDDGGFASRFLIGQADAAYATLSDAELPRAVGAWLVDRVPLHELHGAESQPHAELIESDPQRWHWLNVRDRIADPNDVLAPLRPLIEALASSPIASKFYSFSSLNRFCFSSSSHYPWVNKGLPVIAPSSDSTYHVDEGRCDLAGAVAYVERTLDAAPVAPFFGSASHMELALVRDYFARNGSTLVPNLLQRAAFYDVEVATDKRRCRLSGSAVTFEEGAASRFEAFGTIEAAAAAAHIWLESAR
jgi:hypothetical protein